MSEDVDIHALSDLQTPWCIRVAVTLRIVEHLAAGISDIEGLAAATGSDAGALHSVLGHLVSKGVFEEPAPGRFVANDAARRLSEQSSFLSLDGVGGRFAYAWGTLPTYVRTGKPGYHELFGAPFWDDLAAHPDIAASFDALMGPAGHGVPDAGFDITGGWDPVRSVVDVGGGTGSMLAEILRLRPQVRGTLVDLPGTVARAAETFRAAGVSDRVTTIGQSFFDPLPPGADVYLLKSVLNDWPEAQTVQILRRCADAAGETGLVVIIGGVAPDGVPRQMTTETVLVGGRTDSLTGFRHIAGRAGLQVVSATQQRRQYVVECRPYDVSRG